MHQNGSGCRALFGPSGELTAFSAPGTRRDERRSEGIGREGKRDGKQTVNKKRWKDEFTKFCVSSCGCR